MLCPLLIGGCPRSGSTALLQMLNSNPAVYISSEENILNKIRVLGKLLGTKERRTPKLSQGMRELSARETLTMDNIHSHNFSVASVWPAIQYIYEWHHRNLYGDVPLTLLGDKLPNYFKEIYDVLAIPNVRYLHLTRNPFDVVNSMLRRTEMSKQGKDWWKAITDFDLMIEAWAEAYSVAQKVYDHPKVLHLHYEELLFNFDQVNNKINSFLGTDLIFENILISKPSKHFDRSFLNDEMLMSIMANKYVKEYVDLYSNDESVALSLNNHLK
jgi:hypothetical protein